MKLSYHNFFNDSMLNNTTPPSMMQRKIGLLVDSNRANNFAMRRLLGRCVIAVAAFMPSVSALSGGKGFGSPKASPFTHQPTCQKLVYHLLSQKAIVAGVEVGISQETDGIYRRGLFATKNISEGSAICKIPSDLALALSDPAEPDDNLVRCGANYLKQYAQAEQWRWYTETFPEELPLTPDAFGDEEQRELLEFPLALAALKERQKDLQKVTGETGLSIGELQSATTLVSSRSFPLNVAEENGDIDLDERGQVITKVGATKSIRVLVPLIDMANHRSTNFNAKLVIQDAHKDDAWFVLQAARNIRQGQEITVSYGAADSVDLLLNYGFTPDDGNPVDAFMLRKHAKDFPLDEWSTTLEEDMTVLEMLGEDLSGDEEDRILRMVLKFRIQLKQAYAKI